MKFVLIVVAGLCLSAWSTIASAATSPQIFPGRRIAGHSILANPDGSWNHIRVRNVGGQFELSSQTSTDNGLTWGPFSKLVNLPSNDFGTIVSSQIDATGEIQTHIVRPRGTGSTPNTDFFLDLWQVRSFNNQTQWSTAQLVFEGYVPDLKQQTTLSNGRIVAPFFSFAPGGSYGPPTGLSESTVMYSDDRGATWQLSPSRLRTPVSSNFNGDQTGGVEPIVIDQPSLNRQWMLIRTQADYLYESFSFDNGTTWADPTPSIFASSDSPGDYERLPDGRLMMFWNNTRNSPRFNGQGVYSGRDTLHAAISEDEGQTWQGFREIYIDPTRHQTPPTSGDRGVAIPHSLLMNDGTRVAVMTGQGPGAAMLHIDPEWLYETSRFSDFSNNFQGWTAFTSVGPASGFWRDRVVGPQIVAHPNEAGEKVMWLNNPDPNNQAGDGAVWNFTMGSKGRITIRMQITDNTKVADIQLTDRFLDPTDDSSSDVAIFNLRFNDRGEIVGQEEFSISKNEWHEIAIDWNLQQQTATLLIDDVETTVLPQLYETLTGVSYLRLRSPFVSALDPDGWLVDWVDVRVTDARQVPEPGTGLALVGLVMGLGSVRRWCGRHPARRRA